MKKRLVAPDFIKGISIVLMVFGHIAAIGSGVEIHRNIVNLIYTFHIPLFLIISGYFFSVKDENVWLQISKQLKNIGLPYIIFITIYLLALLVVYNYSSINTSNKPPLSLNDFLYNIFIHPMGGYWFLHSLIVISILFIICNFLQSFRKNATLFLLSIWCGFLFVSLCLDLIMMRTCFYFFMGFVLSKFSTVQMQNPAKMIIFGIVTMFLVYDLQNEIKTFNIFEILWCWSVFVILWGLATLIQNTFFVKIFCWFGRNTLVILVLHTFFILIFKTIKTPFLYIDDTGFFYSFMTTIFTILLSLLSARLFDYLKVSKFIFSKNTIYSKYQINND